MARTESTMLALGTPAPGFSLPDVSHDRTRTRDEIRGRRPLLVVFLSRHCPYVQHVAGELARIDRDFGERVAIVGIAANDVAAYPEDAPVEMAAMAREFGYRFPILYDEGQEVARAYRAACTPDFFLFDADAQLAYRGQLDDSRPRNDSVPTGRDLRRAIAAVLAGEPADVEQRPSIGCNIKWRAGHEPEYFVGRAR